MVSTHTSPVAPFPSPQSRIAAAYGGQLLLRRFGDAPADLGLDFGRPLPAVVTDLIVACTVTVDGRSPDRSLVEEMSVGARIACLLTLVRLGGVDGIELSLRCSACGEALELDLEVDEVLSYAPADDEPVAVEVEDATVLLRRPTGSDQLAWLSAGFGSAESARESVLRSLALSPWPEDADEAWLSAIEAALDEHDPLVCFSMDIVCPACTETSRHEAALTDAALRMLRGDQGRLLQSVHVLASRYGWSEREVLSLPAWRRDRYVTLANGGAS